MALRTRNRGRIGEAEGEIGVPLDQCPDACHVALAAVQVVPARLEIAEERVERRGSIAVLE
jgi:hypothetical protein